MDVSKAIEPKSDQQNADSLLTGPRTIKIRDIKYDPAAEAQKLWLYFDGDDDKPWKPCKTSARCLVQVWGADANKWIGLSCTIYCDPEVVFGGARVGGIRISHMEGLTQPRTLSLTKTRGKKGATVIKPLEVTKAADKPPTVDRADLQRQSDAAKEMTPDAKKAWWAGLTKDEKAVVTELNKA